MASIKFDEYRVKLHNLSPVLEDLGKSLGLEAAEQELDLLQAQSAAEDFWSNMEKAQKVSQRIKNLQDKIEAQNKRLSTVEDLLVLCEMGMEEDDDELLDELESTYAALEADIESARLSTLFRGEYDHNDCMLSIHAGPAAPRPRTGPPCCFGCTSAGRTAGASSARRWTMRTATRRASRPRP